MTGTVRTVLGDIDAADLGVTYAHEHLIIESELVAERWPHIFLNSVDDAVDELARCRAVGVGAMIDAMPMASGRRPTKLAEISTLSGVHIVMATGLHTEKYYERQPWLEEAGAEELSKRFTADITEGADADDDPEAAETPTSVKAGIVKVATSHRGVTERAMRLFEAAWLTMQDTGVPMLSHCEEGEGAMDQIEALASIGVPLERVIMSHTDKVDDSRYHTALLETGVNLEFDQALRQASDVSMRSARLLATQLERGFVKQLMLGTDGARRSLWSVHGHPLGLAFLADGYRSILDDLDVDQDMQNTMFVSNPARVLTLHTPTRAAERMTTEADQHRLDPRNRETV